jgi:adenosylcobinamide-GDP ribazoletransferase
VIGVLKDLLVALRYLTRLPTPVVAYTPDSLARAAKFFPVVGLVVAAGAVGLNKVLSSHADRTIVALLVMVYLVVVTGCLHEDGLADAADGFGAGWSRERILEIMHDSRIGSYGAIALTLSLLARYVLLGHLPLLKFSSYVIAAHVLCRWTSLPLGFFLPPATEHEGQGAQVARRVSMGSLIFGTLFTFGICYWRLRNAGWIPVSATAAVTLASGLYYKSQIGGVTGDCFGATNQLSEIAVYACGVLVG